MVMLAGLLLASVVEDEEGGEEEKEEDASANTACERWEMSVVAVVGVGSRGWWTCGGWWDGCV